MAKQNKTLLQYNAIFVPAFCTKTTSTIFALTSFHEILAFGENFSGSGFFNHHSVFNNELIMSFVDLNFPTLSWHFQININVYQKAFCYHSKNGLAIRIKYISSNLVERAGLWPTTFKSWSLSYFY